MRFEGIDAVVVVCISRTEVGIGVVAVAAAAQSGFFVGPDAGVDAAGPAGREGFEGHLVLGVAGGSLGGMPIEEWKSEKVGGQVECGTEHEGVTMWK